MSWDMTRVQWRVGQESDRTIYAMVARNPTANDVLIGVMITGGLAHTAVEEHNAVVSRRESNERAVANEVSA